MFMILEVFFNEARLNVLDLLTSIVIFKNNLKLK